MSPDGRREIIATEVSAATAAAIDDAGGARTRSAWLDDAITAHLRQRRTDRPTPTPPSCSYHPDADTKVGTGGPPKAA
jgi:hypothetical protein